MRYYLPGALFLIYLMILTIPYLPRREIPFALALYEQPNAIIGIFTGAFVISPVVGYLIYGFYNHLYERMAMDTDRRGALKYIEDLPFESCEEKKDHYKKMLRCDIQKKEFLDLIYHSNFKSGNSPIEFDSKIIDTLKGHLSNFSARYVCSVFVPIFCFLAWLLIWLILKAYNLSFTFSIPQQMQFFFSILGICFVSAILYWDCKRVLFEAYQLEEYFIKAKEEVVKKFLKSLFPIDRKPEKKE